MRASFNVDAGAGALVSDSRGPSSLQAGVGAWACKDFVYASQHGAPRWHSQDRGELFVIWEDIPDRGARLLTSTAKLIFYTFYRIVQFPSILEPNVDLFAHSYSYDGVVRDICTVRFSRTIRRM